MQDIVLYNKQIIGFLEELWGDGFLSPGGPDEVALVINKIDIAGKHVLDIGSGSGVISIPANITSDPSGAGTGFGTGIGARGWPALTTRGPSGAPHSYPAFPRGPAA